MSDFYEKLFYWINFSAGIDTRLFSVQLNVWRRIVHVQWLCLFNIELGLGHGRYRIGAGATIYHKRVDTLNNDWMPQMDASFNVGQRKWEWVTDD